MPDAPANPVTIATFEAGLRELEAIVKEMEAADLPLEKAVELFERGTRLSAACRKHLAEAETRVEILMKRAGAANDPENIEARPFRPQKQ
jgi:exodeoxyribonuclease VII small subunit